MSVFNLVVLQYTLALTPTSSSLSKWRPALSMFRQPPLLNAFDSVLLVVVLTLGYSVCNE